MNAKPLDAIFMNSCNAASVCQKLTQNKHIRMCTELAFTDAC